MSGPLISVIMGVYYSSEDVSLLNISDDSIRQQTYSKIEFLICDDGSSENAMRYLEAATKEDDRIILVRPGHVFPLAAKLNCCLKKAKGKYIARMDDDDRSHPDRLEKQIDFLEQNGNIAFVGCQVSLYQKGTATGCWILPALPRVEDFYIRQPFIHPALLFRKIALEAVSGYSESKQCILCEDYDLLLRLYAAGFSGANLQEVLLDYTLSPNAKGGRRLTHRWNEVVTRWNRFRDLHRLPGALPYVIKPLLAGTLPSPLLQKVKKAMYQK